MASSATPKKRSFVRDVFSVMKSRVISLTLTFVTGVAIARFLGPEGKGVYAALLVFPSLITSFADLGIRQATVYQLGKKDYPEDRIIAVTLFFTFISSLLSLAIGAGVYYFVENPGFTLPLVLLALATIPTGLINTYAQGIFLGKEQIKQFSFTSWLPSLIRLVGILVLVGAAGLYVTGALVAGIIASATLALYSLWLISRHASLRIRFVPEIAWQMLSLGIVYAAALFVLGLNYKVDIVILQHLRSNAEVGQYTQGVSLAELLWQLPTVLSAVLFSKGANAKDPRAFSRNVAKLMRVTLVVAALGSLALFAVVGYFIPLVYGQDFTPSILITRLLLPGIVAFTVYKVLNMDLAGKGRPWLSLYVAAPAVVLNIALNLLLIPQYGANGAALASTMSYTLSALAFMVVYARAVGLPLSDLLRYRRSDFDFIGRFTAKLNKGSG